MTNKLTESLDKLMLIYETRNHPLHYQNLYQLVVMVVLSAQDSDKHINQLAPSFFEAYPTFESLSLAQPEDLHPYLRSVRNFRSKCKWLVKLASVVKDEAMLPLDLTSLVRLSGIGRKSANVILREAGCPAEGIIVDLHVLRVAPRIGIAYGNRPEKIEQQLMRVVPKEQWNDIGMAISFLGREVCRPKSPKCDSCVMNPVCCFHNGIQPDVSDFF